MNTHFTLKASLVVAAMLVLPLAQAATMTKGDYKAGKTRISEAYKADKAACAPRAANAKDICTEEARGKEKVALAELEYGYTGKTTDHNKVLVAKAESNYAVAKEKCDDKAGNDKDVCLKEAKAVMTKAQADAKAAQKGTEARMDANKDKRDADYKVAAEKCDAMSGDAKDSCVKAAKARYGK